MKFLVGLLALFVFPVVASAEVAVCFNATRPLGSQFYHNPSVDPSKVTDPNCSVVTKASGQTASQLALIASTIRGAPASKYLKVTDGLAVAMTSGEQDAVDADLAAKAAAHGLFTTEVATQDLCSSATLAEVDTKVDTVFDAMVTAMTTDINAITNVATAKTAITTVAQQLSSERVAFKKLLRCMVAIRKGAR